MPPAAKRAVRKTIEARSGERENPARLELAARKADERGGILKVFNDIPRGDDVKGFVRDLGHFLKSALRRRFRAESLGRIAHPRFPDLKTRSYPAGFSRLVREKSGSGPEIKELSALVRPAERGKTPQYPARRKAPACLPADVFFVKGLGRIRRRSPGRLASRNVGNTAGRAPEDVDVP